MQESRRILIIRSALVLFGLLIAFTICEISFRFYLRKNYKKEVADWRSPLYKLNPGELPEYSLYPNAEGVAGSKAKWPYKTNADGFRGPLYQGRTPGKIRIAVLCDSYGFGWGLKKGESPFPEHLQRIIPNSEVVNLSVPGYNTIIESQLLRRAIPKYHPDIIIMAYVMNDSEPPNVIPESPDIAYQFTNSWLWEKIKDELNARIFDGEHFFQEDIYKWSRYGNYIPSFEENSMKWKLTKAALQSAGVECKLHRIPFFLVILPAFEVPFGDKYKYAQIHETVSSWGHEFNITTLDLFPFFKGMDYNSLSVPNDGHPNERASILIAEQIALLITRKAL